jgi:hypothetical protein
LDVPPLLPATRVSFSYFTAQEALRLWPVGYVIYRQAAVDDFLPLSKPITLTNGKVVNEIPIPKGQKVIASVLAYNRFGFNPFSCQLRVDLCANNFRPFVMVY